MAILQSLVRLICRSSMWFLILCFFSINVTQSDLPFHLEDQECLDMLPPDYKKYEAPKQKGEPITVSFHLSITNIDEIDEGNMDFNLHGYLRATWKDERLFLNGSEIRNIECAEYIWTPSLRFRTVEKKETFDLRENLIYISENLTIYAQKYIFTVGCRMYFKDYPFDTQHCEFLIGLLDDFRTHISIKWQKTNGSGLSLQEDFKPLQFFLRKPFATKRENELVVLFVFVRQLMGSFINVFLPSTLIVAVSWISFWIRVEAAPARVALSVTSLLTLCTQVQNHKSQLPSLNYIIALDIWLFVCIFMVFATLVEFAISYNSYVIKRVQLSRNSGPEGTEKSPKAKPNGSWMLNVDESDNNSVVSSQASKRNWWLCGLVLRNVTRVDLASRVLFPLTFSVFAITYWAYYLLIYNKE